MKRTTLFLITALGVAISSCNNAAKKDEAKGERLYRLSKANRSATRK